MSRTRSISTVLDVALALLLISASVTLMFVFLQGDDPEPVPVQTDRTAETFTSSTATVGYTLGPAVEHDADVHGEDARIFPENADESAIERTSHGTITGILGDAAIENVTFWDEEYTRTGAALAESVDGVVRSEATAIDHGVRLDAVWRPYEGYSGIEGRAGAGQEVPPDADVSSVTVTLSSGFEDVSAAVAEAYEASDDFDAPAQVLAQAVVDGLLEPAQMQRALESSSLERELALYRYNRLSAAMAAVHRDEWDEEMYDPDWEFASYPFHPANATMDRETVNAAWLNHYVVEQTLANRIAEDFRGRFGANTTADELAAGVTIDEVQITVRTWGTDE